MAGESPTTQPLACCILLQLFLMSWYKENLWFSLILWFDSDYTEPLTICTAHGHYVSDDNSPHLFSYQLLMSLIGMLTSGVLTGFFLKELNLKTGTSKGRLIKSFASIAPKVKLGDTTNTAANCQLIASIKTTASDSGLCCSFRKQNHRW